MREERREPKSRCANPFAIDLRALGVLRIALAAVLLVDLALRATRIGVFYADAAAHPLERARQLLPVPISLHLISAHPAFQGVLFALALAFAGLLLVGYRTRLMTALSWYLLISLHHRSYHLQDVGDQLLRLLLVWGIFLPLGERYSIDARRLRRGGPGRVASLASAGFVLQVAVMYFTSVFHKLNGTTWARGEALEIVLQDDLWVRTLGRLAVQVPGLPAALTYATLAAELLAPLLLISPFATKTCRAIGAGTLTVFAVGIGTHLQLGVIPWVVSAALIPFYPERLWERLDRAIGSGPGSAPAPRAPSRAARLARGVLPALLLVQLLAASIDSLLQPQRIPRTLQQAAFCLGLTQAWGMYAPDPVVASFRLHLRLDLEDGQEVRLVLGSPREGWPDGDTLPALEQFWNTYRGRMFLDNVVYPELAPDLQGFLVWACRQWSAAHPDRPVRSAGLTKELRSVSYTQPPPGGLYPELRTEPLLGHVCSDHYSR